MENNSNNGGKNGSVTPSTALLNRKLGISPTPLMLKPSEIALLRRSKKEKFLDSARVYTIMLDDETSEYYAQVFSELRQKGRPIPSNDLWLAASALQHGLALATYDEHFSNISGLLLAIR